MTSIRSLQAREDLWKSLAIWAHKRGFTRLAEWSRDRFQAVKKRRSWAQREAFLRKKALERMYPPKMVADDGEDEFFG